MQTETNPAQASSTSPDDRLAPSKLATSLSAIQRSILSHPVDDDAERRRAASEAGAERTRREQLFREFIGERKAYVGCKLSEWKFAQDRQVAKIQHAVVDLVGEFIETMGSVTSCGALFYGPPGTGKDYLATCIARVACLDHGQSAQFVNGAEWFISLRDSMDDGSRESALVERFVRPQWLVLSDPLPPKGDLTPYQASMLYRLVDARISRGLPLVTTVNVADGAEAVQRMGAPTWDRMKQGTWVFGCSWQSFRKPAREV